MATLIVGLGGIGGKVFTNISRKVRSACFFVGVDSSEPVTNSRYNTAQKLRKIVVLKLTEKMRIDYSELIQQRISRFRKEQIRNEYRSAVNDILAALHQTNQKQDVYRKICQDQIGMSCRDFESNGNPSGTADRYVRNIGLILKILEQQKSKQRNCETKQYRQKNGLTETENQSDSEQRLRQLQKRSQGMSDRKFSYWNKIMLRNDGEQEKTDMLKVCEWNQSQDRMSPNHMSRLFVFPPELRTKDENRQMSVISAA